jgi:hypothetical protein
MVNHTSAVFFTLYGPQISQVWVKIAIFRKRELTDHYATTVKFYPHIYIKNPLEKSKNPTPEAIEP